MLLLIANKTLGVPIVSYMFGGLELLAKSAANNGGSTTRPGSGQAMPDRSASRDALSATDSAPEAGAAAQHDASPSAPPPSQQQLQLQQVRQRSVRAGAIA